MRFPYLILALLGAVSAYGQEMTNTLPKLPKDPRDMLAAVEPFYDFRSGELKPWHLKGKYQLFDLNGNPGEQGTYEYWWISRDVDRSTWTRPSGMRTEWHIADGRTMSVASGARILSLERELRELLVSAVPDISKLSPEKADIKSDELRVVGKNKLPCAEVNWRKQKDGTWPTVPNVRAGAYCFQDSLLRAQRISNTEYIEFDRLMKTQDRIVAGEIIRSYGARKMFTFSLDEIDLIAGDDAALKPAPDAKESASEGSQSSIATVQRLVKRTVPVYPAVAKASRLRGAVLLDSIIGTDGKVRDMYVLASPSPYLTKAAEDAVSQWQYAPYVADGVSQEICTRITVIFELN